MKTEYKQTINWVKLMLIRDGGRPPMTKRRILSSKDIYNMSGNLIPYFNNHDREEMIVIGLDGKNRTLFFNSVSVGCLTSSIVHPREVFKPAILGNAVSIILVHNHPSGDPTPSPEDIEITKRLVSGGEMLGIKVLDHVIIGENSYLSFADKGLL